MNSLIKNRKKLKPNRSDLNKSNKIEERGLYIAKINGRRFYHRSAWLSYLDKCLGLND